MRVLSCAKEKITWLLGLLAALVFFLAAGLCVYAQEASTQEADRAQVLFRFPAGGIISTGPVCGGGRVWFVSDNRYLYVLTSKGIAIGKRDLGVRSKAFIACDPYGRAVVPEGTSSITMLNRAGQAVWTLELEAAPSGAPAFGSDGRLFLALGTQTGTRIVCLSQNGRRLWSIDEAGYLVHPPVSAPGGCVAYALSDGTVRIVHQNGAQRVTLPVARVSILSANSDSLVAVDADGSFSIYRQASGPVGIQASGPASIPAGLQEVRGKLPSPPKAAAALTGGFAVLLHSGALCMLGLDGTTLWNVQAGLSYSAIHCFHNRIVLLGQVGASSYDTDGRFFRRLDVSNPAGLAAVDETGSLFCGGSDWILYAYRFESGLSPLPVRSYAPLTIADAEKAARETALWLPSSSTDDSVTNELNRIAKSMVSGETGMDVHADLAYASAVALGMLEGPAGLGARKPSPSPSGVLPRSYACTILGMYGSPAAVPILAAVFARDPDPAVRAAAADAVASIGLDPDGLAQRSFMEAASGRLDERSALSLIDAVAALYRANGVLDEPAGALALVRIVHGAYPKTVRDRASLALKKVSAVW